MSVGDTEPIRPEVVQPDVDRALLDDASGNELLPVLRVENFFQRDAAVALLHFLANTVEYDRIAYGEMTQLWRARRPLGDVYFGPIITREGQAPHELAVEALAVFESQWFVRWLSCLTGTKVSFLRPPTPYRLDPGDRICLHDDMSDPTHAVSVALNLTPGWCQGDGGETRVGLVTGKLAVPTPIDCPTDLYQWQVASDNKLLAPNFNSILVLRLSSEFAHGVEPVRGKKSRYSVTTIYGHAVL